MFPARTATNFNARTLDNPGLKRFMEQQLNRPLESWPLKSWDFPALTLAAWYFHPSLEVAQSQWRVAQAHVVAAGGRVKPEEWLGGRFFPAVRMNNPVVGNLREAEVELVRIGEQRLASDALSHLQLALFRLQLARTRLALILALREKMDLRERLADSLGLPMRALFEEEVTYDFSRAAGTWLATPVPRTQALQGRSDILNALADYAAAETALRFEIAKRHPNVSFQPGCRWDQNKNRWAVNLKLELPADHGSSGRIAKAEARRIAAAAQLLSLQAEVIDEVEGGSAAYRATLDEVAEIDSLAAALRRQHDALVFHFKTGTADQFELLLARLQLVAADLTQLEAQVKLQDALGSLEDAVQRPAELMDSLLSDRAR